MIWITHEKLKEICLEYDHTHGRFPENQWEGRSVFIHLLQTLAPSTPDKSLPSVEEWEAMMKDGR